MNALSVANVQIGNIQIGNDKIGNDKIRNAEEWPFLATACKGILRVFYAKYSANSPPPLVGLTNLQILATPLYYAPV